MDFCRELALIAWSNWKLWKVLLPHCYLLPIRGFFLVSFFNFIFYLFYYLFMYLFIYWLFYVLFVLFFLFHSCASSWGMSLTHTIVFFESKHRILDSLTDCLGVWGELHHCVVVRELTKVHEHVIRGMHVHGLGLAKIWKTVWIVFGFIYFFSREFFLSLEFYFCFLLFYLCIYLFLN
jgi:hypothetical protein